MRKKEIVAELQKLRDAYATLEELDKANTLTATIHVLNGTNPVFVPFIPKNVRKHASLFKKDEVHNAAKVTIASGDTRHATVNDVLDKLSVIRGEKFRATDSMKGRVGAHLYALVKEGKLVKVQLNGRRVAFKLA